MDSRREDEALVELELRLSNLLAAGVTLSALLILLGIFWLLLSHRTGYAAQPIDLSQAHPEAIPHTLTELVAGLGAGKPLAIVALGLLCLVLTPVFRVATSIVLFALQRDVLYTLICSFVLAMLVVGMLVGAAG